MASNITPGNIDGTYPIAGIDNDTQGFRTNFTNTSTNLAAAKLEIEDLQSKAVLKAPLTGESVTDNDMLGEKLIAAQLIDARETTFNLGTVSGGFTIDHQLGHYQYLTTSGSVTLTLSNFPTTTLGRVRLEINVTNVAYTLTLPAGVTNGVSFIDGYAANVITFSAIGVFVFEFYSYDATTFTANDLTREIAAGGGDPDQNLWLNIDADSGGPVAANTITDTLTLAGGSGVSTAIAGDTVTITNDSPNATHTGQVTGATALALDVTAITAQPAAGAVIGADTLIINDGGVLSEVTITQLDTFFDGDPDQNLWLNIAADSGGPVAANTITDTLTLAGGTSISTAIAGDTVTITNDSPNATHTGQVTGATALALDVTAITAQPAAGAVIGADTMLINDGGTLSEVTIDQLDTFLGGGGGGDSITDADSDTSITTEASADEDIIRFNTGAAIANFPAQPNALLFSSGQFTLALPVANVNGTKGGTIALTAGAGLTGGGGGDVNITGGVPGTTGTGGDIDILAGDAGSSSGGGGNINILAGDGKGIVGGKVTITSGSQTLGAIAGGIELTAGTGITSYAGGAIDISAGVGGASGPGGDLNLSAGNAGATSDTGGDIVLTAGTGSGGDSAGAIVITDQTAPTVTTNKLYSVGGALTWNGTDLTAGGGGGTSISDANSDTQIQVEESANEDIIRFDTGAGQTNFPAQPNALVFSSAEFTLALPQADQNGIAGGAISLTAGQGSSTTSGTGGAVNLTGGAGGSTGGIGGAINLTAGTPSAGNYTGGKVDIIAGNGNLIGVGGALDLTSGTGGLTGSGGILNITSGNGGATSGNGGAINITTGSAVTAGGGGKMTLTAGNAIGGGIGGAIELTAGVGISSYAGGAIDITGGIGGSVGPGGAVTINGGSGGAGGDFGGAITIKAGSGTGAFIGGNVTLEGGEAASGTEGVVLVRGSFGFENQALGTITTATDINPDAGLSINFTFGAAATAEIGFVSTQSMGVEMTVEITNGGQGTLTWGAEVDWAGGTAPTLTAAGIDLLKFWTRDGSVNVIGWVVALNVS